MRIVPKTDISSKFLGNVPVIACMDHDKDIVRVMKHAQFPKTTTESIKKPNISSQALNLSSCYPDSCPPSPHLRAFGKKIKVPRPPNAFILYRQHWHSHYKQHNSNMHNNEISKEIGKKWKSEPTAVKAQYKRLAEDLKVKHTELYPDYQYAPRKPGEKKRRMTARKLEKLRAAQPVQEAAAFSFPDNTSSSGVESPGLDISVGYDTDPMMTPSPANDLSFKSAPNTPPKPIHFHDDGTFTCVLPCTFDNIQAEIDKECGKYGQDYIDVAENNSNLIPGQSLLSALRAETSPSQTNQQNEWESLIDWHGLDQAITGSEDMNENEDQDVVAERKSGPDQAHKTLEEPTVFWK